jgi:hypothetical protein
MADDWAAFAPEPAPAEPWAAFSPQAVPTSDDQADHASAPSEPVPESFLHRLALGMMIGGSDPSPAQLRAKGFEDFDVPANTVSQFQAGLERIKKGFHDTHSSLDVGLGAFQSLTAPISAAFQAIGGAGEKATGGYLSGDQINTALMLAGGRPGRVSRVVNGTEQVIGGLPAAADFENAARSIAPAEAASAKVEENLRALWQERGLHPAEIATDSQSDEFLRHDVTTAKAEPIRLDPADAEILDVKPGSLSAAITDDPPLIPPSVQPLSPPGSLAATARNAIEQFQGLTANLQYMLDPMATGSNRAMVIAKDAINSVRRIRWDHARLDADIESRFSPDQRGFMWTAADEESVLRQAGEAPVDTGLMTLSSEERAVVEDLHARAQSAWLRAVDAGMVEGEGLPAYTPRMVLNVANAGDAIGPQALNELGRNVSVRTAQMLHRKYLTAEETEEAAKQLVGSRMAERGASIDEIKAAVEKVQIARDIRALPLATAKLEEAIAWRQMINKVEEVGKAAGEPTVAVGHQPDHSWFTIAGNPAFTRWAPMLERDAATGKWAMRMDEAGKPIFQPKPIYMPPEFRGPMTAILDASASNSKVVRAAMAPYEAMMALKGKAMTAILNSPLIHNQVVWGKVAEAAGGREWLGFGLYWRGNKIVNGATGRAQELIERGLNPMGPRGAVQDITGMMEQPSLEPGRSLTSKIVAAVPGIFDEGAEVATKRAIDKLGDFWHNTLLWDRVRDVHFGLADHLSDHIVSKGIDRITADRIATHFSNIIVGSIPKEAMSQGAAALANLALFSRSFTLGNLATFKQAMVGLPKPIMAQIERDYFDFRMNPETGTWEAPPTTTEQVRKIAQGMARRKAISTIGMSTALSVIGGALVTHAFNMLLRDASVDDELKGYARRYKSLMRDVDEDPTELRHMLGRLSPQYDNEPRKQDRVYLGQEADKTAAYMRLPFGKFGEEMMGWPTQPMQMLRQKLSPMASFGLDVLENDDGMGNKIYDEKAPGLRGDFAVGLAIAEHLIMKHLPANQMMAGRDLLRGDGDPSVNAARVVGPGLGFTVSEGRRGGMAKGELSAVQDEAKARFSLAWPDIKKQILRGEESDAKQVMAGMGISPREQNMLIRNAKNPSAISGRQALDFYRKATPEQQERFDRARGQ